MQFGADLVEKDMDKAKVPNAFSTLVFIRKTCLQELQIYETSGKAWIKEDVPFVEEDRVMTLYRTYTNPLDLVECKQEC